MVDGEWWMVNAVGVLVAADAGVFVGWRGSVRASAARPYGIHHPPFTIHHSPSTIHHPLFTIHYSPSTIHYSPVTPEWRKFCQE
ncbi:MAG: hypothetical protein UMU76_01865, partial [Prosthecochloris sp.]|nr:hypothetical protein [Prosthecochloris sp.]